MNRRFYYYFFILFLTFSGLYYLATCFSFTVPLSAKKTALSPTTYSLLDAMREPVQFVLYSPHTDIYHEAALLVEQYQAAAPKTQFVWKRENFSFSENFKGEAFVVHYGHQTYFIDLSKESINEATITQLLFKCSRHANHWVVFLEGHGEPQLFGKENRDYQLWRLALENQGLKIQPLTLNKTPFIPDNVQLLIIASSQSDWLPHEEALVVDYISKGKNLLWLIDPTSTRLHFLEKLLGISPLPGTIVDLHGQKLGTPHPAITLIEQYPSLPFTTPKLLTAYPWSVALAITPSPWEASPLLLTDEATWTETDPLSGQIGFDPEKNEKAGPLLLGVRLTRSFPSAEQEQRIAVIGNSRFISNGVIQNYGNLAFGQNLISWLNADDQLLKLEQPISIDSFSHIHLTTAGLIQYGFPGLGLLLLFVVTVYSIKRRRHHHSLNL